MVRIRKRSFWILTILGPVLYALLIGLPVITKTAMKPDLQSIYIIDKSGSFSGCFNDSRELKFFYMETHEEEEIKELLKVQESSHILIIAFEADRKIDIG